MNVLIINGHPGKNSFSAALTNAYFGGATAAGADIKTIFISDLSFDPNVAHPTPHLQWLGPDIKKSQELISWANHVVFIYPTWWGTMPALLKAFIDRVFISGFASPFSEYCLMHSWVFYLSPSLMRRY